MVHKHEMIERIAAQTTLSKAQVSEVVSLWLEEMVHQLGQEGSRVELRGLGTFVTTGQNVRFRPGRRIKEALSSGHRKP
ncbi:MAG: HU family DNA-binding protein [Myxococcota bacterium]